MVQTSMGRFALRISTRGRERVAWEHECIAWAADHGLPVCRPISLRRGGAILEWNGVSYSLFPLAIGLQIMRSELNIEHARAAGECLARIHAAFQMFPPKRTRVKNLDVDLATALASIPRIRNAIQALPIRTEIEESALEQLAGRRAWLEQMGHLAEGACSRLVDLPKVVVHGDFQETNMFFEGRVVSSVIDWDQSGLAPRGWEVMRALHLMLNLASDLSHGFLSGYRSVLPLPECELQHAALCYGVLADSNLWVYQAIYLEGNVRAKGFIGPGPFVPFHEHWAKGLREDKME